MMNKEVYAQTLSSDSFYKAFPYETTGVNSRPNAAANCGIVNSYNRRTKK